MNVLKFFVYCFHPNIGLVAALKLVLLKLKYVKNIAIKLKKMNTRIVLRNNDSDWNVFSDIIVYQRYEIDIGFTPKYIIDGGANIGISSLFFAKQYPQSQILAIEPSKDNVEMLYKNCAFFHNVKIEKAAIYYKDTYLKIVNPESEPWSYQVSEVDENDFHCRGCTIDTLMENHKWQHIDILKLDIEGSEELLFKYNFISWINKVNVFIIELHDEQKKMCAKHFFNAMSNIGDYYFSISGENIIIRRKNLIS